MKPALWIPTESGNRISPIADAAATWLGGETRPWRVACGANPPSDVGLVLALTGVDLRKASRLPRRGPTAALTVGLVPDFVVPVDWWSAPRPQVALVPHPRAKGLARDLDLDTAAVVSTGGVVPARWRHGRDEARRALGVDDHEWAVFLAARDLDGDSLQSLLLPLGVLASRIQLLCDATPEQVPLISSAARLHGLRARRLADLERLGQAVAAADSVVGQPEPPIGLLAAAAGVPTLVTLPKTEPQIRRGAFWEAVGAGHVITHATEVTPRLQEWMNDAAARDRVRRAALALWQDGAEQRLPDAIEGIWASRSDILAYAAGRPAASATRPSRPVASGLEEIGISMDEAKEIRDRETAREIRAVEVDVELAALKERLRRGD